ncbi:YdcF family protein [Paenibacillus sp. S-38]|uniref:YdcF family protein n=1 Tax=Paenibacillus sp. S-38 TaxID=3416710 RepID=UPI003CE79A55
MGGKWADHTSLESTEWEFLRHVGLSLGVPDTAILREDQAAHTFDNARLSREVLQQAGIHPRSFTLVCKNYHARGALLTYQLHFPRETVFHVSPVVDNTGITKENWHLEESKIHCVMNELEKVGTYFRPHILRSSM